MTVANLLNSFIVYGYKVVCRIITVVSKNQIVLEKGRLTYVSKIPAEYLNKKVIAYVRNELTNHYIELEVYI